MLKAVFFDAADTLIHLPRSVGEHYRDVAGTFGYELDVAALDRAFRDAWKEAPSRTVHDGPRPEDDKGWWRALVGRILERILAPHQVATFPRGAYFEKVYARFAEPGVWVAFPEVRTVLKSLRARGLALLVVSNFDGRLRTVLRDLELASYFQHLVISSEVGADKPDPRIFQRALALAGVGPEEALHAGDDPKRDWGAAVLGMEVFELDRPRNSLRDLLPRVEERLRGQGP